MWRFADALCSVTRNVNVLHTYHSVEVSSYQPSAAQISHTHQRRSLIAASGRGFHPGRAGPITGFNRFSIPQPDTEASIEVPISVIAPYCPNPQRPNTYFRGKLVMAEDETVGLHLDNLFTSAGLEHMGSENVVREYMFQVIDHQDPQIRKILLVTYRDRIFEIPRSTVIKEIWAGVEWPREGPLPFKEWNKTPRPRAHEVDGATMRNGNSMILTVVLNEHMQRW